MDGAEADSNQPSLDERKFAQESAWRNRELALKEREISAKESELRKSRWLNPTVIGLFAAAIGLIGNLVVAFLNNENSRKVERSRGQSSLIIQAVSTGNPQAACKNLISFIRLGLLDDSSGTMSRCESAPETIPVLPASVRTYPAVDDTGWGWGSEMAPVVTRVDEKDHYRFEVTFTVPKPPSGWGSRPQFNLVTVYAYRIDSQDQRADEITLPPRHGNWKVGDRVTISAELPRNYFDDPAHKAHLRYCIGSQDRCVPSGNLLLPRG
jgi:hypothetical protein